MEVKLTGIASLFLTLGLLAFLFITFGDLIPSSPFTSYGDVILLLLALLASLVVIAWIYVRTRSSEEVL